MSRQSAHVEAVPVTSGSSQFITRELGRLACTRALFPAGAHIRPHVHDCTTLGVILNGGFELRFGSATARRRSLDCRSGAVFTEPAGEKHANIVGPDATRVVVIQLDPAALDETLCGLRPRLLEGVRFFRNPRLTELAGRVALELGRTDPVSDLAVEALALEMLVVAARGADRWYGGGTPPWVSAAEEYIRENFRERIRLADVAEAVGVGPARLATVFSRVYGIPLGRFVRLIRLDWATQRLISTSDPIASIAYAAGFADQAHLTRAFRARVGETPGAYRRAHGKQNGAS